MFTVTMGGDLDTVGGRIRWLIEVYLPKKEGRPLTHRQFAERIGVKPQQLSRWINDPSRAPGEESIQRIAEAAGVSPAWLRYGDGALLPELPHAVVRERPAHDYHEFVPPNYEGLGIEIPERSHLVPRAREAFDRFVHELIDRGLGREDIEHFGRAVIAPIAHLNTLHRGRDEGDTDTEEAQLQIIERNADVVRRIIRSGGGGR